MGASRQAPLPRKGLLGAAEVGTVVTLPPHPGAGWGWGRKSEAGVKTQTTTWGSCSEPRGMRGERGHVELVARFWCHLMAIWPPASFFKCSWGPDKGWVLFWALGHGLC